MAAVTLSAMLMASSFVVLRSCHAAWVAHEADVEASVGAIAAARHIVRVVRQAEAVEALTAAPATLAVRGINGSIHSWRLQGQSVTYSLDGGTEHPLADGVVDMRFDGFAADGSPTAQPSSVRRLAVWLSATTNGSTRGIASNAWIRSW